MLSKLCSVSFTAHFLNVRIYIFVLIRKNPKCMKNLTSGGGGACQEPDDMFFENVLSAQ